MTVYEPQGDPIPSGTEAVDTAAQGRPDLGSFLSGLSAQDQQRFHDKVTRLHFGDAGLSYEDAVDATMKNFTPNVPAIDAGHQPTPDEVLELWTDTPDRAEQIAHVGVIAKKIRELHTSNISKRLASLNNEDDLSGEATLFDTREAESPQSIETRFEQFMRELSISNYRKYEEARDYYVALIASTQRTVRRHESMQDVMDVFSEKATSPRDEVVSPDALLSAE